MTEEIQKTRDNDPPMVLNPITGRMRDGGGKKRAIRQYSHNSERITFSFPRTIEGHDMGECTSIEVHFNNIEAKSKREACGVYPCLDVSVEEERVTFSWLISRAATRYAGTLGFLVVLKCVGENGELLYSYPTEIYDKIIVSKGMDNSESVADEDYSDLLSAWRAELLEEMNNLSLSWNRIEDKPFGEVPAGIVLSEGTITCEEQSIGGGVSAVCALVDPIELEAGQPYSVEFDGTVYEVTTTGETAAAALALVDGVAIMSESAEETTALMVAAEEKAVALNVTDEIVFISGIVKEKTVIMAPAGQHSYKVSTAGETIKKLDPKYLPDDLGGGVSSWNDLTDKPFYTEAFEYVANADTVGTETFEVDGGILTFVSPDVAPLASIVGSQVRFSTPEEIGEFMTVTEAMILYKDSKVAALMIGDVPLLLCYEAGEVTMYVSGAAMTFTVPRVGMYAPSDVATSLQEEGTYTTWKGENVHKLDEKYLPEVPIFDLTALGLAAVVIDGDETALQTDTTEILVALAKGDVKFRFLVSPDGTAEEAQQMVVQPTSMGVAGGIYVCTAVADCWGEIMSVSFMIQDGAMVVYLRMVRELPKVTAEDNEKILQVVDGVWTKLAIADSAVKTYIDDYINTALGGDY